MKNLIFVLLSIVMLASCSTPKYTYYFDRQNKHVGKDNVQPEKETSVLSVDSQILSATLENEPMVFPASGSGIGSPVKKTYLQMNKVERKTLRHQLKKEIKTHVASAKKLNSVEAATATQAMDHDLKLAAIFGAVGIVGLAIIGSAEIFGIIGGIALLIGVVFFVKWIIRQ